jgi:hypothetical protein
MFSPLGFPNGLVVYDLTMSTTIPSHRALIPFELYRETLVVVAISDGQEYDGARDEPEEETHGGNTGYTQWTRCIDDLRESHPSAFVHQLFIFDCDAPRSDLPDGAVSIPSRGPSRSTNLKTVMCDLTSMLLTEMTTFARSVQALPNLEIPKSSKLAQMSHDGSGASGTRPGSRASSTADSRAQSPANDIDKHSHRASLPAHLSASIGSKLGAETARSRSAVDGTNPVITFDQISDGPERPTTSSMVEGGGGRFAKDRVSVHGFGSGGSNERARGQAQSRIGVVIGSMHLLAGRWPDAVKELVEAAAAAKANSDYAWHAKALDYLLVTMLMYAWAGMDFDIPQMLYPFGDKLALVSSKGAKASGGDPASARATNCAISLQNLSGLLPDLANNILHLYTRAAQFSSNPVPQVVYSETTIRVTKLLTLLHRSFGSLDENGLQHIVLNKPLEDMSSIPEHTRPCPSKADIASLLYRAFPGSGQDEPVDIMDRLSIFAGMAAVLSSLQLHRKKAFILRELLAVLLPALIQSRKHSAAEQGVHPAASLSTFDIAGSDVGVGGILGKQHGMDHGIQQFLVVLCEVYGVILTSLGTSKAELNGDEPPKDIDDTNVISKRAIEHATKRAFGNSSLKLDVLRSCINICEALPDLRGVLRFSSDLLNTAGSGIAPGPGTMDSSPSLPVEDQARLANNIARSVSAAAQLGFDNLQAEYWDEFLLRDIELSVHGSTNTPSARKKAELDVSSRESDKKEGPFIYNPFAKPAAPTRETVLIAGEEVTFIILVQNLYDFELEIEWIKFDALDTLVDSIMHNIRIGAYRTEQIQVTVLPKWQGQLKIEACIGKIRGCRPRRFPLFRDQWRMKDNVKVKKQGLLAASIAKDRPLSVASDVAKSKKPADTNLPTASIFEAKIIKTQPTVVLKSTSLPQAALMLLEGETRRFTVTLENISKTAVDLLLLSSTDSTSDALQANLDDSNLTSADLYDAEINAYKRPALTVLPHSQGSEISIPAGGTITIDVEIYGKLDLTHATLRAEYGHLGVPRSEMEELFYTRQLSIPFSVTVGASVGLVYNDFLPFTGDFAWSNQMRSRDDVAAPRKVTDNNAGPEQRFQGLLNRLGLGSHGEDHCLVVLDFFNAWTNPISLSLKVRSQLPQSSPDDENWKRAYTVHEVLQPGHASRVLVLLPRLTLANAHKQIPSLRNKRQFVVSTSQMSPELERMSRELFWFREEALKYVRATWSEVRTGRTGQVDLRRMTLAPRMLNTLKLDEVGIETALVACQDDAEDEEAAQNSQVLRSSRNRFSVTTSSFFRLTTTLTSRLAHPMYPLLRLQPALRNQPYNVALDLSKKLAFNGALQRPLPLLKPGERRDVSLGVVFLAAGEYEFGACVEEVRVWKERKAPDGAPRTRPRAGTGELRAEDLARTDRRTWYAKEACTVDVRLPE